jgi:hypothetical protein
VRKDCKKGCGGLKPDQAKKLKERENALLKQIVADLSPERAVLREVASGSSAACAMKSR